LKGTGFNEQVPVNKIFFYHALIWLSVTTGQDKQKYERFNKPLSIHVLLASKFQL
jgi:hypothetical protein